VSAVKQVLLDLPGPSDSLNQFRITLLPGGEMDYPSLLLDLREVADREENLEPVQLLEGAEYRYEIIGDPSGQSFQVDPSEVFAPDDPSGRSGRLRPGLNTGSLRISIASDAVALGVVAVEVRSRKLDYLSDYRKMLSDIAEVATEAVMERFASSEQSFLPAEGGDPLTLYQRFAFLQSLLLTDQFQASIQQIISRPYEAWEAVERVRRAGQGIRSSSSVQRQLTRPGPRIRWPGSQIGIDLPAVITESWTEATLDNEPNRFVKFALVRWREVVQRLHEAMASLTATPSAERGVRESQILLNRLDAILGEELFREVLDLQVFPSGNQVLQKREGYRDVFRAYIQFEVAAQLTWRGGEDVYEAGQRDVATLYEYWAYLELAAILSSLCQTPFEFGQLLSIQDSGVGLDLVRGKQQVLIGEASRLGRALRIEMWYNKKFSAVTGLVGGSWTVGMRPDFAVRITADPGQLEYYESVWVHFDAKYRVNRIGELLAEDTGRDVVSGSGVAKRDDLLKMHAYRDAIRASAGAFVLYPGDKSQTHRTYTEILPGLGAFVLKPDVSGEAIGAAEVRSFLNDVLDHVARQASQHERERFWRTRIYQKAEAPSAATAMHFLRQPPADTKVLVGFVKNKAHLNWIHGTLYYNLRGDDRRGSVSRELLDMELLLLWGRGLDNELELWRVGGTIETLTRDELLTLDYPEPRGQLYYCLPLAGLIPAAGYGAQDRSWLEKVLATTAPLSLSGEPALLTWKQLYHS
jgi:uncharacterized protein